MDEDEEKGNSGNKTDFARSEPWRIPPWSSGRIEPTPREADNGLPSVLLFPEIVAATACVIFSPIWSTRLFNHGHYIYAILLLAIGLGGGFSLAWFIVKRKRFIALWIIVAILVACLILNSLLPQADRFM
jgi:hypothetical protein